MDDSNYYSLISEYVKNKTPNKEKLTKKLTEKEYNETIIHNINIIILAYTHKRIRDKDFVYRKNKYNKLYIKEIKNVSIDTEYGNVYINEKRTSNPIKRKKYS